MKENIDEASYRRIHTMIFLKLQLKQDSKWNHLLESFFFIIFHKRKTIFTKNDKDKTILYLFLILQAIL
jgi:hypothetical protein